MEIIAHIVQSRIVKLILHHFSFKWAASVQVPLPDNGWKFNYIFNPWDQKKVQKHISDFLHDKEMLMQQMEESCQHKLNMYNYRKKILVAQTPVITKLKSFEQKFL